MPKNQKTMTDSELLAIIRGFRNSDIDALGNNLIKDFVVKVDKYYEGRKRGDEKEGRSKVVSRDLAEVIDSLMPDLMRIFAGFDKTAEFIPTGPEDMAFAEQATDYCNWIFDIKNQGFLHTYNHIKAGLMYKIGVLKVYWDESKYVKEEDYTGLSDEELNAIEFNPDVYIIEQTSYPNPQMLEIVTRFAEEEALMLGSDEVVVDTTQIPQQHDVRVRRIEYTGQIKIDTIPNEEFYWDPYARDLQSARWLAHARDITRSELLALGYDEDDVDEVAFDIGEDANNYIKNQRFQNQTTTANNINILDESQKRTKYWEFYTHVDYDGDGIAEYRKVCIVGSSMGKILHNEITPENPFVVWSPILIPHRMIGTCPAEQAIDIQDIKTAATRGMLDNYYRLNNARLVANPNGANMDDVQNSMPGATIRAKNPATDVVALTTPNLINNSLQVIDHIDKVREYRTGVSRMAQGLDPDSLSETFRGTRLQMNAGQLRKELIARVYGETALRAIFQKILRLAVTHLNKPQMIQLRGQWISVDPTSWKEQYDVSIRVGLGTNDRTEEMQAISRMLEIDAQIIQLQGGANGPIVTLKNVYNKLSKLAQAAGLGTAELYYTDPDLAPPQPEQPEGAEGDPAVAAYREVEMAKIQLKAQGDAQKAQLELQKAQLEQQKAAAQYEKEIRDLELEIAKLQADTDYKERKLTIDTVLKAEELRQNEGAQSIEVGGSNISVNPPSRSPLLDR